MTLMTALTELSILLLQEFSEQNACLQPCPQRDLLLVSARRPVGTWAFSKKEATIYYNLDKQAEEESI